MKNLYLILRKDTNHKTFNYLKDSAESRGVNVYPIYTEEFDFSRSFEFDKSDGIYRIATDRKSSLIEKYLANQSVVSFYKNHMDCIGKLDNVLAATMVHQKLGFPIIKTVYSLTQDKKLLKKYVDQLNGFPLIIKSAGGQHGVGVMKIDSFESLNSISDFLLNQGGDFILREFIDYTAHARLIVLGDEVISSVEYKRVVDDFRSNAGDDLRVVQRDFSENINKIAVDSVQSLGLDFGGVDILIDKNGNSFIAEVNFPCFFPRAQEVTGVDISRKMIDFLIEKSR